MLTIDQDLVFNGRPVPYNLRKKNVAELEREIRFCERHPSDSTKQHAALCRELIARRKAQYLITGEKP